MFLMKPADNHVHTEWSWDTSLEASMQRSCERAVQLGIPSVAFTEHVDFTAWGGGACVAKPCPPPSPPPLCVGGSLAPIKKCRVRRRSLRIPPGIGGGEPHL